MIETATLALATYLENAALSWMHLPDCGASPALCAAFEKQEHETPAAVGDRIQHVAASVALLFNNPTHSEAPIWADDTTGARTGLLLMNVAFNESRFRGYVDDGRCNDPIWREGVEGKQLLKFGTCDGGHAFSIFQIHAHRRLWLTWDGSDIKSNGDANAGDVLVNPTAIIANRELALTTALHMLRKSIKSTNGSLRYYTGEWSGPAPKAAIRLEGALAYERRRSFLPEE